MRQFCYLMHICGCGELFFSWLVRVGEYKCLTGARLELDLHHRALKNADISLLLLAARKFRTNRVKNYVVMRNMSRKTI